MNNKEPTKRTVTPALAFRWTYILLPLALFFLSTVMIVYFYRLLPADVAYHFKSDGSPDRWLNRGVILLITVLPQIFFTLLALIITWGMTKLAARFQEPRNTGIKPESLLSVMGNMVALPQLILFFAMLDIFSYNAYRIHLMPLWVFALVIMVLGGIILGVFFARTTRRLLRTNVKEQ